MGTWDTKINGNDTFQDIYQSFFDLYNQGENAVDISQKIKQDFADEFEDYEDRNNCVFGLAFAQWETKSLSAEIFKQVNEIIESGKDLELWKELGADEKIIKQRKIVLEKFLKQISTERERPKRQVRPKSNYEKIALVNIIAPDLRKTFTVSEEYNNKEYLHISAMVKWESSVRPVFFCGERGKKISAEWNDSQTLTVTYDKSLKLNKWDDRVCPGEEKINVIYIQI